ncbi:hypothetical protein [Mucilaginibacter gotjawali]|uniref:Uncharacterized protein n=1 Tax=Mucilaginibacter gotjawali TaxID=1550579 RepID=A0A839SIC4_9SPHI|nr:hypothetical protein [Mucilaginibacter gotjawali]MBB3057043.1 hypothetical protein [Mucilaginibacter gotjawali]
MPRVCNLWLCIAAVFNRQRNAVWGVRPADITPPHGGESTHPVIAPLDLPSLPQAAKRAKKKNKTSTPSLRPAVERVDQRSVVGVSPPADITAPA